eukprot:COSAG01_NODE_45429_length_409_cov_1.341935_1_plen_28_part_10
MRCCDQTWQGHPPGALLLLLLLLLLPYP